MNAYKILENEDLGALSSPFRRQLLEELRDKPDSAVNIARRHDMSRQRVGYHMRDLEKAGFIEVAGERQQRGLKERLYRAKSVAYVNGAPEAGASIQDRFSWASLANGFAQGLWQLVTLRRRADAAGKKLATLGIEANIHLRSAQSRKAFTTELIQEIERLVEKYDEPAAKSARPFTLLVGAYPSLQETKQEEETDDTQD